MCVNFLNINFRIAFPYFTVRGSFCHCYVTIKPLAAIKPYNIRDDMNIFMKLPDSIVGIILLAIKHKRTANKRRQG